MTKLGEKLGAKIQQYYIIKADEEKKRKERAKEIWKFISSIFEDAKIEDYDEFLGYEVTINGSGEHNFYYTRSWVKNEETPFPWDYDEFLACAEFVMECAEEDDMKVNHVSGEGLSTWEFSYK